MKDPLDEIFVDKHFPKDKRLEKLKKNFISEEPFKKTSEDKLFEKARELETRLNKLEIELKIEKKENKRLNNWLRKLLPAFPSQIKGINDKYILEQVKKELEKYVSQQQGVKE